MKMEIIKNNVSNQVLISKSVTQFATEFKGYAQKTAEGVLRMSEVVFRARQMPKQDFQAFCTEIGLKPNSSTIRKFLAIGEKCAFLMKHKDVLPANWTTLYQVSRLATDVIEAKIKDGSIHPLVAGKHFCATPRKMSTKIKQAAAVPNGTAEKIGFSVSFDLVLGNSQRALLESLISDLETKLKGQVRKSARLEQFLKATSTKTLKAA
jgi:hypothetical protein